MLSRRVVTRTLLSAALVAGLSACTDPLLSVMEAPSIRGEITAIDTTQNLFRILVEENRFVDDPRRPGGGKTWLGVTDVSQVVDTDGRPFDRSRIRVGQRAAAQYEYLRTSYPGQAHADVLVID